MPELNLKTISIDSFKGGRTNFLDQTTIDPSMCASGSQNVWAPQNVLTKGPGLSLAASFTASGTSSINGYWCEDTVATAIKVFYGIQRTATGGASWPFIQTYLYGSSYAFTDALTPLGYTVGTVAVGGVSATGSGTLWSSATGSARIAPGDYFQSSQNTNGWYQINSIEDDTHLTLLSAVPTSIGAGTSYTIQLYCDGGGAGGNNVNVAEAVLNGNIVFSAPANAPVRYDGTNMYRMTSTSTASSQPPGARFLATHQGYMFAGYPKLYPPGALATGPFPSRIMWSNLNDATNWGSNNFIDIDLNTNGDITGLKSFGQELIVFKNRGMYKVVGTVFDPTNPTYFVQKITTPPDFLFNSNASVAIHTTGNASISYGSTGISYSNTILVFYASGRIYGYQQGTTFITRLSDNITLDLPNSSIGTNYNLGTVTEQQIVGSSYNGYYFLAGIISPNYSDPSNAICLIMDRNMKWWLLHNNNNSGASSSWLGDPFGSSNSGTMRQPYFAVVPTTTTKSQLVLSSNNNDQFGRLWSMNVIGPTYTTTYPLADATNGTISYSDAAINGVWVSKELNIEYGTFYSIIIYLQKQSAGNLTVQWSIDQGSLVSYTLDMTKGRGNVIRAVIPIQQKGSTIQLTLSNPVISQTFGIYAIKLLYYPSEMERLL